MNGGTPRGSAHARADPACGAPTRARASDKVSRRVGELPRARARHLLRQQQQRRHSQVLSALGPRACARARACARGWDQRGVSRDCRSSVQRARLPLPSSACAAPGARREASRATAPRGPHSRRAIGAARTRVRARQPARTARRAQWCPQVRSAALRTAAAAAQEGASAVVPLVCRYVTARRSPASRQARSVRCVYAQAACATCQAAENAKSHGYRLRRGAALPSNPCARWVTEGRQRPLPLKPWVKTFLPDGSSFPSLRIFCSL